MSVRGQWTVSFYHMMFLFHGYPSSTTIWIGGPKKFYDARFFSFYDARKMKWLNEGAVVSKCMTREKAKVLIQLK